MKKMLSLTMAAAILLMAVSCSEKQSDKTQQQEAQHEAVEVSQLMYKQDDIMLPKDFSSFIDLSFNDGVKLTYKSKDGGVKQICYDGEMNELSTLTLAENEKGLYDVYAYGKNDGNVTLLLMFADYDKEEITDFEDYHANAKLRFELREYSAQGERLSSVEIAGFDKYFRFGESFLQSITQYGENYIINFSEGLALINKDGELSEVKESEENYAFGADTEGRLVAASLDSYGYMDGTTLNAPEETSEYGKWIHRSGGLFMGNDDFKLFFMMNEGIFGLTYGDELIQVLDYTDSNINPNGIFDMCRAGEGKFAMYGYDQNNDNSFFTLLTVRPDDYIESKQTVVLGVSGETDSNVSDIISAYNNQSDSYVLEVKNYDWENEELKKDILSGNAPDAYAYNNAGVMYNYANLGGFADMYGLMEQYGGFAKEDVLDNVIEAFEYKEGLYGISPNFYILAYIGNSEVIPQEKAGWNFEEFFEIAENLPEEMYLGNRMTFSNRDSVFEFLCQGNLRSWVDFENAACNFDSEEFVHILEFCRNPKILPERADDYYSTLTDEELQSDTIAENLMLKNKTALLYSTHGMQQYSELNLHKLQLDMTEGEYTWINPPSNDRSGVINVMNRYMYSVVNNGSCIEGGWDFVNYIMSFKYQTANLQMKHGFTTRKDSFEHNLQRFIDENKEMEYTINGVQIEGSVSGTVINNGLNEETIENIRTYIASCNRLVGNDEKIRNIVAEEYESFKNGDVTAEDCAKMIQNRVEIYLSEQS